MGVLVTGGAGLIGGALVRLLVDRGEDEVVVFDRNAARSTLIDLADRVTLVQGDLGIFSHVVDAIKHFRPETIYNLGAILTAPSNDDPASAFQTNVLGTFNILEAARILEVKQVLFSSSIGSYGLDMKSEVIDDFTIQRPASMYGVSKVFGENLGRYYKLRYGLDYRGLRYPGIIGPGFRTPSLARYASLLIEESVRNRPVTLSMAPDVKHPLLYFKDAALAMIKLVQAPNAAIKTVNYLLNGIEPQKTAQDWVDMVKTRLPGARLFFEPDPAVTRAYYGMRPLDDRCAREEWNWKPEYDHERLLDDFIAELRQHPERYT